MASRKQRRKSARFAWEQGSQAVTNSKRKVGDRSRRYGPNAKQAIEAKRLMQQYFGATELGDLSMNKPPETLSPQPLPIPANSYCPSPDQAPSSE